MGGGQKEGRKEGKRLVPAQLRLISNAAAASDAVGCACTRRNQIIPWAAVFLGPASTTARDAACMYPCLRLRLRLRLWLRLRLRVCVDVDVHTCIYIYTHISTLPHLWYMYSTALSTRAFAPTSQEYTHVHAPGFFQAWTGLDWPSGCTGQPRLHNHLRLAAALLGPPERGGTCRLM